MENYAPRSLSFFYVYKVSHKNSPVVNSGVRHSTPRVLECWGPDRGHATLGGSWPNAGLVAKYTNALAEQGSPCDCTLLATVVWGSQYPFSLSLRIWLEFSSPRGNLSLSSSYSLLSHSLLSLFLTSQRRYHINNSDHTLSAIRLLNVHQ